jgi:flagellar basal-body rod modification protein FlgD
VDVKGGEGGSVTFDLPSNAANVSLQLLDSAGDVAQTIEFGAMKAGTHSLDITGAGVSNGTYEAQVAALTSTGTMLKPETLVSGVVSGFVPGPDGTLLMNGREVALADIREVHTVN